MIFLNTVFKRCKCLSSKVKFTKSNQIPMHSNKKYIGFSNQHTNHVVCVKKLLVCSGNKNASNNSVIVYVLEKIFQLLYTMNINL